MTTDTMALKKGLGYQSPKNVWDVIQSGVYHKFLPRHQCNLSGKAEFPLSE